MLVLGASGMLGSMVADVLSRDPALAVTGTVRSESLVGAVQKRLPGVEWRLFDGERACSGSDLEVLSGYDWVINCIGVTKPLIRDDHAPDVERAVQINTVLPYRLGVRIAHDGGRMLQIATDCVYSGARGAYREDDPHDALDVYGKTKSLGEARYPGVHHLRCSIVGPEPKDFRFLLEWFRRQSRHARVKGYTNHRWNGITTLHFAKLGLGIIKTGLTLPAVQHVVPGDTVTKEELLREFARWYRREDIEIEGVAATSTVDRTLGTGRPDVNRTIWQAAGYPEPPRVSEMVGEVSRHDYLLAALA